MVVYETDRNINKLSDNFKLKVIDFLKEVWDKIFITEWFRTQERQNYLYAKWRTTSWNKVTWVKHSKHQDWLAIDIAFNWDILYPNNIEKWDLIAKIAKKHWIDWWYDLWNNDKPHFQDNWKPYIIKNIKMEQFWKLITKNWLTYPKDIYWIPVRLWKTRSKTLVWLAKVKWYLPWCEKDEIVIFKNTFKRWEDYLYKVLMHEFSHFIYHRYLDTKEDDLKIFNDWKSFWEWFSSTCKMEYISNYAKTQPAEDFAELIWFSYYIKNKIELPNKYHFNKVVQFKYEVAIKLYVGWLNKYLKSIKKG